MKKSNCYAIQPIRTDADYRAALALVEPYFDNEPALDSEAGAHFEAMLALIEGYEAGNYPIISSNPMEAIFLHAS
jgi:HTH-type transcriptional regulator/antitoxin HigA